MELAGLLQFIVRQLKFKRSLDLVALQQLVAKMSGFEVVEDMSESVMNAMAGGNTLRAQSRLSVGSSTSSRRKSTARLKDALTRNNLTMPLLVLISQQRQSIIFQTDSKQLKLVGSLFDTCSGVLIQFTKLRHKLAHSDNFVA